MNAPRAQHTATLLYNGKVLLAGGQGPLASAELYDPATGIFTPTGKMTIPRAGQTATLLPDGNVLIAGGWGVEVYDPAAGTFRAGSTANADLGTTATLLGNGKVLFTGIRTAQLYDPASGTFSPAGPYATPRAGGDISWIGTATLLQDGRVLVTGCLCAEIATVSFAQLYDPKTNSFSPGTVSGRTYWGWNTNTATLLPNGKVLIAGNAENDGWPADVELFDPATGVITDIGSSLAPHEFSAAALLPNGQALLTGGQLPGGGSDGRAELYDPATGTFRIVGNMTVGRFMHTATLLRDGSVLIAGGYGYWLAAEIYRPAIAHAPSVKIVDNITGSLTTLAVGDSFSFLVSGAAPRSEVTVSQPGWSASLGYTDADGSFTLNGIVAPTVVGTWHQTWSVGGVAAQPNPLSFTVTPK